MDNRDISNGFLHENTTSSSNENPPILKRKRNLPGNPDPEAEVISLSPKTLMATNRFVCEICLKGFQRDQNLQLHRRGHNLPWKLKQRTSKEIRKRVYVCPEKTCVHNHPSRALGDLTGIKKHFCRKHGEKKWKCEKCSKFYAVQSDMKAHSKTCGTREYKCDCGTIFSRRDSFVTHRAFCEALAEETARINGSTNSLLGMGGNNIANYNIMQNSLIPNIGGTHFSSIFKPNSCTNQETTNQTSRSGLSLWMSQTSHDTILANNNNLHETYHQNWVFGNKFSSNNESQELTSSVSLPLVNNNNIDKDSANANNLVSVPSLYSSQHQSQSNHQITTFANMSATALLQKAAQIGTTTSTDSLFLGSLGLRCNSPSQDHGNKFCGVFTTSDHVTAEYYSGELSQMPPTKRRRVQNEENVWGQTRDFLGVGGANHLHPFIHQKMDLI